MKFVVALSMLMLLPIEAHAQLTDSQIAEMQGLAGVDIPISEPSRLLVQEIDGQNNRVRLANGWYRLAESRTDAARSSLMIDDLKPGMEIFVQTDGTEPSSEHEPLILDFWVE